MKKDRTSNLDPTAENTDHCFFYLPNYSRYLHASYGEAKGMVTAWKVNLGKKLEFRPFSDYTS